MASRRPLTASQYLVAVAGTLIFAPLMLHLSRLISPIAAFIIAFAAVALLVGWSLRRSHGLRFAIGYGVIGLVITLGLLSAAALLTSGSGLVVTVALLLLIGFGMYVSPRLGEAYAEWRAARVVAVPEATIVAGDEEAPPAPPVAPVAAAPPTAGGRFCAYCGQPVAREFRYCPSCSREVAVSVECPSCGVEICRACGSQYAFCPACGARAPEIPAPEADAETQ